MKSLQRETISDKNIRSRESTDRRDRTMNYQNPFVKTYIPETVDIAEGINLRHNLQKAQRGGESEHN